MFRRKIVALLVVASSVLIVPTVALAANPPCELREHRVTSVEAYRPEERVGRATFPVLRGARLYVQAEPGLTAEWLRHKLGSHIVNAASDCALDVSDVTVDVESAGAGFRVILSAPDTKRGEEILRRARLLLG